MEELTDVTAEFAKKHVKTKWLSMKLIWVWMLEQMGSLTLLAWQKNFEQEIIPIMWYNSIQAVLENSNTSLHFILSTTTSFK